MARVHSQKAKALLYTLPFPITIALIGSQSLATSLSLTGLMLTASFLWGSFYLHNKLGVKILYADVLLAVFYVLAAYALAHILKISFWIMLSIYLAVWSILMWRFKTLTFAYTSEMPSTASLWLKAVFIFVIAFLLFSAHQYLAAFVVTFPYNGVFAVYENRFSLLPQAALFTRNSLALVGYFVANYLVGLHQPTFVRYGASWLAFGVILILVNTGIEVRTKTAVT